MMNYTSNWIWNIFSSFTLFFFIVNVFFQSKQCIIICCKATEKKKTHDKTQKVQDTFSFQYIFSFILIIPVWWINWLIVTKKSFSLLTESRSQSLLVGPHRPLDFPHRVDFYKLSALSWGLSRTTHAFDCFYKEANVFMRFEVCGRAGWGAWLTPRHFRLAQNSRSGETDAPPQSTRCTNINWRSVLLLITCISVIRLHESAI